MESKIMKLISEGVSRGRAEMIAAGDADQVELAEAEAIATLERKVYELAVGGSLPALQYYLGNRAPSDWMAPGKRATVDDGADGRNAFERAIMELDPDEPKEG